MRRIPLLIATTAAAPLTVMLALAAPALAHVTVTAPGATRGGTDQQITFQVPVEKNIETDGLTVALPVQTPIASVLVEPIAGWTHTTTTVKLAHPIQTDDGPITNAVSRISWRALPGHGLQPGEYGAFRILAGQLPDVASLTFKALQDYRDGSVVKWNQVAAPGATAEPDNPAPVLQLGAPSSRAVARSSTSSTSNTGPYALAITALVLAAAALALAVVGRIRRPR